MNPFRNGLSALTAGAACVAGVLALAACGSSQSGSGSAGGSSGSSGGSGSGKPIVIGVSLSETGDFSDSGKANKQGYTLWANQVNAHGGLLGRKVQMKFVNDGSSAQQVVSNYQTLISGDHVNLVFGPFSSLLTIPSSEVAARYGYAFVEPAGGSKEVFTRGLHNIFEAEPQAGYQDLLTYGRWLLSLPASERPKTAAYLSEQDPFLAPEVTALRKQLEAAGVKTLYNQTYPTENPDYSSLALAMAHTKADVAVLGVVVSDGVALTKGLIEDHYSPKAMLYTSGPDQGEEWVSKVGKQNVGGMANPIGWLPTVSTFGNKQFVQAYVQKYGGNVEGVPTDAAEAYSVGQVVQQAVEAAHSVDNAKVLSVLHSGRSFKTIQGNFSFNAAGEPQGSIFVGQWVNGHFERVYPPAFAQTKPLYPKPAWGKS